MQQTVQFRNSRRLRLAADLLWPAAVDSPPVVVMVHGWRSGRASARNRMVADALLEAGIAVLLPDLTGHGDSEGNIAVATIEDHVDDVRHAIDWLQARGGFGRLGVAGSSSGAAVALRHVADDPRVTALVLRAPSPHARRADAARVQAPTLVIQGEADALSDRNRDLTGAFHCEHRLAIVPRASHLFDEPGAMEAVARHAAVWFRRWLAEAPVSVGAVAPLPPPAARDPEDPFFRDRADAGRRLADRLGEHRGMATLVLALPRGGIAVAEPIAEALEADLDVCVVRKIRAPHEPELGLGAVAEDNAVEWNEDVLRAVDVSPESRQFQLERARRELADQVATYRSAAPRAPIEDRTVILVDDGVATGGTLRAAVAAVRRERPRRLVVALPGGPPGALSAIAALPGVDALVAPVRPRSFRAVSQLYDEFPPVTQEAVCAALRHAHARRHAALAALNP